MFLWRVAAYFQGCLASLPLIERPVAEPLTVIDTVLDGGSEPLQIVRMNRHLSRRLRWLIKRGRVQRSGEMRLVSAEDKARCNLTPGQMNEYCIRTYRWSRIHVYGLGFARGELFLNMLSALGLCGNRASLEQALTCQALLAPD